MAGKATVSDNQRNMPMTKTEKHDAIVLSSLSEKEAHRQFTALLKSAPLPDDELLPNLGLFLSSKAFARLLFFYEIYQKILHSHGVIVECGVRWGQTLSILSALRGSLEPYNRHRHIIGFDTFAGFKGLGKKDGKLCQSKDGSFSVSAGYEDYLTRILSLQEQLNPMAHLKRFELIKGDAVETVPRYFQKHPETIVSLAIFDFDIYQPTRAALQAIKPHLCKGSILVFDELSDPFFPGETVALDEVFGLNNVRVKRLPMAARISYLEIE
jgi:methyltransferase family protein